MSSDLEAPAKQPIDELAGKLERTEIQHRPSSIPGREIVQVLTEIPAGVESGWHTHPGEEVGYILAGTVDMEIEGQPTLTLLTGHGFLIPPRTPGGPMRPPPSGSPWRPARATPLASRKRGSAESSAT